MAESHGVSALVNKRAEIAGVIARTEQQLGQFRADLDHLDATLRLFAPELERRIRSASRRDVAAFSKCCLTPASARCARSSNA